MRPSARPGHGRHAATILLACTALMVADASCTKVRHLGLRGGQPSDRAAWGGDGVERGRAMETMRDPVYGAGVGDAASSLASRLSGIGLGGGRSRLRVVKRSKDDTSICTLDTKMLFQRKEQGSDVKGPPVFVRNDKFEAKETAQTSRMVHSSDGRLTAQMEADGATVYVAATGERAFKCQGGEGNQLQGAHLSPKGTFLVTCSRHGQRKSTTGGSMPLAWSHEGLQGGRRTTEVPHGLAVWEVATGELKAAFEVPLAFSPESWPYIQWSNDEQMACRQTPTGFDVVSFKGMMERGGSPEVSKVIEGAKQQVWMSPNVRYNSEGQPPSVWIAAFVSGKLFGQDAHESQLEIYEYPSGPETPTVTVGLGKAEECTVRWAYDGSALLVLSNVVVDDSNDNYYGKTRLQFVSLEGKTVSTVKLDKEGPVHDASWCPTTKEFIVIYGKMPARAVLYNYKGVPSFSLGSGSYNSVIWSPHGRFFVLGGFGNLPGRMQFWDKATKVKLGESLSPCAIHKSFSPCSRFLLTAVTFPSLRVDNEIRVFKYDGTPLYQEQDVEELYQCEWLPSEVGAWDDRSASPDVLVRAAEQAAKAKREADSSLGGRGGTTDADKASMLSQNVPSWGRMGSFRLHDPGEDKVDVGEVEEDAGDPDRGRDGKDAPFGSVAVLSKAQKKRLAKKRAAARRREEQSVEGGDEQADD